MPQLLLRDIEPFRVLAVIRKHASSHAFVETVYNCKHLGWYARACEYLPQLSVNNAVRYLQVDEAHVKGGFPLSSELLQPANGEKHIHRGSCGAEAALFLRE